MDNVILYKASTYDGEQDGYVTYFESKTMTVEIVSPIDFNYCNQIELKNSLETPSSFSGILLTSPRCVQAISNIVQDSPSILNDWKYVPAFVVGEATDRLATNLGFQAEGKECGDALHLGEHLSTKTFGKPILYPLGSLARDTLRNILEKAGIKLKVIVVYETVPNPRLKEYVAQLQLNSKLVFFSPSGVENILPILRLQGVDFQQHKFYAIGRTTEKSLIDEGVLVSGTSEKPNPEALHRVLIST